ncbi:PIGM [Bugula neritina]|uniref:GPI alpha-1,4-mannosyltransferase I, catalytic subunit n=1 Tax=Bugula neritina TaxID=10212 RepID=A0A7J7JF03_BUGNE|nr:PIGM [Bugula neritina]
MPFGSLSVILFGGVLLRLLLIGYGEWQDKAFDLQYTDIDYSVFSDAAAHVYKGGSPYERETFRYTPLIAYLLVPNVFIHPCFGKLLFSLLDILHGFLLFKILELRGVSLAVGSICTAAWVFNPLPLVVSTRGNAESVLACMVVGTLYLILKKQNVLAALLFALAVHTKTYPIVYAPSIYLLMNEQYGLSYRTKAKTKLQYVLTLLWPSDISMVFAAIGAFVTIGLCFIFYIMYGQIFLDETYLYHITRKDIQHNFSIYFYPLRISEQFAPIFSSIIGLSAFLPQLGATLTFTYKYYRDLPFCWFIITLAFVTFNKVCTSQYFLWYLCLLPLILPSLKLSIKEASLMFCIMACSTGCVVFAGLLL